eukprot:CAMPEP_0198284268 /NCGR_PEP_ID=MMETSP1449-20131203/3762_1 /TAXON_ID=420275 /ORGANISM="Attheya septentrionalis, Strain CCMP2084" /LENGTH=214 /DNA_ID=CAMNT_0043981263 /DNA_START=164 /DNA_END=806 /DNA_ORIENTATION=+
MKYYACKIEAVRSAFEHAFGGSVNIVISSHIVPSNVSDQPMGAEETKRGAMNRARAAFAMAKEKPDFAVGMEGGLVMETNLGEPQQNQEDAIPTLWCMAWMAILGSDSSTCTLIRADNQNDMADSSPSSTPQPQQYRQATKQVWGFAQTGHFALPPQVAQLVVKEGMELGDADDQVFDRTNGKHGSGTVGILTNGMIDRANYYDHALKLALTPW